MTDDQRKVLGAVAALLLIALWCGVLLWGSRHGPPRRFPKLRRLPRRLRKPRDP